MKKLCNVELKHASTRLLLRLFNQEDLSAVKSDIASYNLAANFHANVSIQYLLSHQCSTVFVLLDISESK